MWDRIRERMSARRERRAERRAADSPSPDETRDSISNDSYNGSVRRGLDNRSGPYQRM